MVTAERRRHPLGRRRLLAVGLVACAFLAWGVAGEYLRARDLGNQEADLRREAEGLGAENDRLAAKAERQAAGAAAEREARLKFNLRQPGESVVVVRTTPPPPPEPPAARPAEAERPNWLKWIKYFTH